MNLKGVSILEGLNRSCQPLPVISETMLNNRSYDGSESKCGITLNDVNFLKDHKKMF